MLIEFRFKKIIDHFVMRQHCLWKRAGLGTFKNSLIKYGTLNLLPSVAIYGKEWWR